MEQLLRLDMCVCIFLFLIFCGTTIGVPAVDNFGLLYGSLRTFQAHACDGEELALNCSGNTVISINLVRYGRVAGRGDLCPGQGTYSAKSCAVSSAIQVIEEKCRGHFLCRMLISPDIFHEDPCPYVRKYAEVAYKCRPVNFFNKIVCESDRLHLTCPMGQSITIYNAFYGTSRSEVLECKQPVGFQADDCQLSYATEIVMELCNGRPTCTLLADVSTFDDVRKTSSFRCKGRKYLKVTYSCVNSNLLNSVRPIEKHSSEESIVTTFYPGWARGYNQAGLNDLNKQNERKTTSSPPKASRSEMQSDEMPEKDGEDDQLNGEQKVVGFMSQIMSAHKYVKGNKDKLILYVTLTTGLGLMFFLTVLFARFMVNRAHVRRKSKVVITPVTDDQFFSDSDLEQYDPPENILPAPVPNYTASMRRKSSDVQPRAPVIANGSELNHYFS